MAEPAVTFGGQQVAVLGAGTMGQGLAQVALEAGHRVALYDPDAAALERAEGALRGMLERLEAKGKLAASAASLLARLRPVRDLSELAGCAWVLEAAPERLEVKLELFGRVGALLPEAVLATNTSTLSVTRIAQGAPRPERVLGLHFFNPAPLMRLVEVVPGLATASEVLEGARFFVQGLGKIPIVARDAPGFIVNRVARPFYLEALRLHGEGLPVATIDRAMRGLGFKMGPFELMDLIGLDVNYASSVSVFEQTFFEPRFRPHPLQARMVEAGLLGRKSGRGFYPYPQERPADEPGTPALSSLRPYLIGPEDLLETFADWPQTEDPSEADFVLDLFGEPQGLSLDEWHAETLLDSDLPVLRLAWSGSASLLAGDVSPAELAGFSLVPPLAAARLAELFVPIGQGQSDALRLGRAYLEAQGLVTLTLPDTPGGIGFRILALVMNEAVAALAEGLASAADIDTAMRLGTGYPLGPLEWSEHIGLENLLVGLAGLHAELGEERFRPHPLLRRVVAAGLVRWSER